MGGFAQRIDPEQAGGKVDPSLMPARPGGAVELLDQALSAACSGSDYILVTNPTRLYDLYIDTAVPPVFESTAHLAYFKNGVLGFLTSYDANVLNEIVQC